MKSHSFPSDNEITEIYNRQADFLYRVCFNLTHNHADAEDAVQETFIRLIRSRPVSSKHGRRNPYGAFLLCRTYLWYGGTL